MALLLALPTGGRAQIFGLSSAPAISGDAEGHVPEASPFAATDRLRSVALDYARLELAGLFRDYYDGLNRKDEARRIVERILADADTRLGAKALVELVEISPQGEDLLFSYRAKLRGYRSDRWVNYDLDYRARVRNERSMKKTLKELPVLAKRVVDEELRLVFPEFEDAPFHG
jgi:hypothetical protein